MSPKGHQRTASLSSTANDSVEYFDVYADHSRTLRTWLVAYGIGGPVLFVSNSTAWATLGASGKAATICGLFIAGVAAQVFLTSINKAAMWAIYYGGREPTFAKGRCYRAADRWSERLWIDLVVDWASILLFATATLLVFRVLTRA